MNATAFAMALESVIANLGTPVPKLTAAQAQLLQQFCLLMLKWNQSLNLTGAQTVEDLVQEHLADAFVIAGAIAENAVVVDVGSGGGLPAVPVAILRPDLSVSLVEPRAKRVAFLRTVVRELRLGRVTVFAGRVEGWPRSFPAPTVAMSRATFAPDEWVKVGSQLVAPGGRVFALLSGERLVQVDPARLSAEIAYRLPRGQPRVLAIVLSDSIG